MSDKQLHESIDPGTTDYSLEEEALKREELQNTEANWDTGDYQLDQLLNIVCDIQDGNGNMDIAIYLHDLIVKVTERLIPDGRVFESQRTSFENWMVATNQRGNIKVRDGKTYADGYAHKAWYDWQTATKATLEHCLSMIDLYAAEHATDENTKTTCKEIYDGIKEWT